MPRPGARRAPGHPSASREEAPRGRCARRDPGDLPRLFQVWIWETWPLIPESPPAQTAGLATSSSPHAGARRVPGRAWALQVACRAVRDVRASAPAPAREGRSEPRAGAPRAVTFLPFCPWAQSVSCISAPFCGDVRPPFRLPPIKIDYYLFLD